MGIPTPGGSTRWRCRSCGNLTRFDVTRTAREVDFIHFDLAGNPRLEERTVLEETVESVRCRWCAAVDQIDLVPRPGAPAPEPEGAAPEPGTAVPGPDGTTEPGDVAAGVAGRGEAR